MPAGIAGVERYVIRGGKEGHERLLLLSRERWPSTAALFARAGLAPGMRCIDLGCAGGEVTMEIARLVVPGGGHRRRHGQDQAGPGPPGDRGARAEQRGVPAAGRRGLG